MRGADGVGCSGVLPPWTKNGSLPDDPRVGHYGISSVYRALNGTLRQYGHWLNTLENNDRVAIVVSGRLLRIEEWGNVYGAYFARLFEAYASCLHAHCPASFVFVEDLKSDSLRRFRAVLVVGQTVELEPGLLQALRGAQAAGVAVFHDDTCRPTLVQGFTPLGVAFNRFEKDREPAADDAAYLRFPKYCLAHVPALRRALGKIAAAAQVENPEVFVSERKAGEGRYLFVVNNATPELEPGHLWRITLAVANRVPGVVAVRLPGTPKAVYDVFAGKQVQPKDGVVRADLRGIPARIYASLPTAIDRLELAVSGDIAAGRTLACSLWVRDSTGRAIQASIPVRARLLSVGGQVLDESFAAAGPQGTKVELQLPLNPASGDLSLEAIELFGGKSAKLGLVVTAPVTPVSLTVSTAPRAKGKAGAATAATASWSAAETNFGPHVRDLVLTDSDRLAVLNTMNWDHNLYGVDLATGAIRWRNRAGHYFTFAPQALPAGVAVQGFDFRSAEGYHLYLAASDGRLERRFALYGIPGRQIHRFVPGILTDHSNNFAVAPDGRWVATAGDLGLAVWSREGKLLWSQDWWKDRRHTATLAALGPQTLLAAEDGQAIAYEARTGRELWRLPLAGGGVVRAVRVSRGGKTCALLSTVLGGRVFVLNDGKLLATFPSGGNDLALTADGLSVAVTDANHLKLYSVRTGLRWLLPGDGSLHNPRFAADGRRIAVSSDLGTVYVLSDAGDLQLERDMGALAVPAWAANGDLILATWMGNVCRLDSKYDERWRVRLRPAAEDMRGKLLASDGAPTTRIDSWGNAAAVTAPLAPNLLTPQSVVIRFQSASPNVQLIHPPTSLVDGKPDAPPSPWLDWTDVGHFAELSQVNYLVLDTFRTRLRVTGITLVEDVDHPESWLRDIALEYWDTASSRWVLAQPLLSNAAVHTHHLVRPVEASRFRLVLPRGLCGNLRLGEIVLHGEKVGPSHPDVIARRPLAVLFDEGDDLKASLTSPHLKFRFEDVFSGGRCLVLDKDADVYPPFLPPFGHALPDWDFEIAENPGPGQYRYLQFAWKAIAPQTRGITLQIGENRFGMQAGIHCGESRLDDGVKPKKVADQAPRGWQVVSVDLWEFFRQPLRVQTLRLKCVGGEAAFDRIVLARTQKDLPK
jgi:outer membrane protein assembly factor BamB